MTDALRTYEGPLVRYTARLTGDLEAARDVVQDCFLRLCLQRQADIEDHLTQWLFAVCRNRALELRRKKNMATFEMTDLTSRASDPNSDLEQREENRLMRRRIAGLPPRDQEILLLKFQEGLSYKEISAITDVSVSNVGFILHRVLRRLRSELAPVDRVQTAQNQARREA